MVMLILNLIDYGSNYSDMTSSSCFYSKDEIKYFKKNIASNDVLKGERKKFLTFFI